MLFCAVLGEVMQSKQNECESNGLDTWKTWTKLEMEEVWEQ